LVVQLCDELGTERLDFYSRKLFVFWNSNKESFIYFKNGTVPAGARNFYFYHRVQTGSGAHAASYPMVTGSPYRGEKRPGRESDHSSPCSAKVKNAWSCTSTLLYFFMAWCLAKYGIRLYGVILS